MRDLRYFIKCVVFTVIREFMRYVKNIPENNPFLRDINILLPASVRIQETRARARFKILVLNSFGVELIGQKSINTNKEKLIIK